LIQAVTTTKDNADYIDAINRMQYAIESEETAPRTKEILTKWVSAQKQRDAGFAKSYDAIEQNRAAKRRQLEGSQRQREQEKRNQRRDDRKASATAQIEMRLDGFVQRGDLRGALQLIASNFDSSDIRRVIAERLLLSKGLPQLRASPDLMDGNGEPRAAEYDAVADEILVREPSIHAILHETVHAFTHRLIADVEAGNKTDEGVDALRRLYDYLQKEHPQMMKGEYAAQNLSEFVAEAMSNDGFQRELRRITLPTNKQSVFTMFARAILRVLGLRPDGDKTNALAEAIITTEGILNKGRATAMRGVGKEVAGGRNVVAVKKNPLSTNYTVADVITHSSELNNAPENIVGVVKRMLSGAKSEKGITAIDKFRTIVTDKHAPLQRRFMAHFDGKLKDALGTINPLGTIKQAEAYSNFFRAFAEDGSMVYDAALKLWNTGKIDGVASFADVLAALDARAKRLGVPLDVVKMDVSKMLEAQYLNKLRDLKKTLIAAGDQAAADEIVIHALSQEAKKVHGISVDQQIDTMVAELAKNPDVVKIKDMLDSTRSRLIQQMIDVGRLTPDEGKEWLDNIDYVPFDRIGDVFDAYKAQKRTNPRASLQLGSLPRLIGSTEREVGDVLDNSFKTYGWMIEQVVKQNATTEALNLLRAMGQATKYPGNVKPPAADPARLVMAYEKGLPVWYELPTRWDVLAFAPENRPPISVAVKSMAAVSRLLRRTIVSTPWFATKQVVDDIQRGFFQAGLRNPWGLVYPSLRNFLAIAYSEARGKQHPLAKQFGKFGISGEYDLNTRQPSESILQDLGYKQRGVFKEILHRLDGITRASDLAVRAGIAERTLKETGDAQLARTRAQEFINFRNQGAAKTFLPTVLATIPFANAKLQGIDVQYRALTGYSPAAGLARGEAVRLITSSIFYYAMARAAYLLWATRDDEEEKQYFGTDERVRRSNWLLPEGFRLSVPSEYGALITAPVDAVFEAWRFNGTPEERQAAKLVNTVLGNVFEVFSPIGGQMTPIPAALKPVVEAWMNYSTFTGEALEGTYQRTLLPSERRRTNTTELAIAMANYARDTFGLEVSPIKIDNTIQGYFGSMAGLTTAITDSMINSDRMDRPLHKYLALSTFLYDHEIGTQNVKDFYDAREKYGPYKATLDRLAKTDLEKAIAFQEKHVFELTMAQAIDHSLSELSKVREIQTFLRSKAAVTAGYTQEDRDAHMKEARQVEQELVAWLREYENFTRKSLGR
jgi:hypothetical protein